MLARELTERIARDLGDEEGVLYSASRLLGYLDEAQRTLVMLRPDANAEVAAVELQANSTRQTIPEGACRFLGLTRNMGSDGVTPGYAIMLVERSALDAANSAWHTRAGAAVVDNYAFNSDTPDTYYVSPPPAPGVHAEMEYAATPATLASSDDPVSLSSVWFGPLREYVMYLAYSENATDESQRQRAEWHLQKFYLLLGEENKAKIIYQPRNDNGEVQR